jgi:hypothetical protein
MVAARIAAHIRQPDARLWVPVEEIARRAGHANSRTTELVYRHQLKPIIDMACPSSTPPRRWASASGPSTPT